MENKKNAKKVTVNDETIGPAEAYDLMTRNHCNRTLTAKRVAEYSEAMERGEWLFTGESILVDAEGYVIDGQGRLWAVYRSSTTQRFVVVRGLSPEAVKAVDQGKSRGDREIAEYYKCAYPQRAYSIARWMYFLLVGDPILREADGATLRRTPRAVKLAVRDFLYIRETYPGFEESGVLTNVKKFTDISGGYTNMLAAFHALARPLYPEDADQFVSQVVLGNGKETSPSTVLRNYFEMCNRAKRNNVILKAHEVPKHTAWYAVALTVHAFNAFREGHNRKALRAQVDKPLPQVEGIPNLGGVWYPRVVIKDHDKAREYTIKYGLYPSLEEWLKLAAAVKGGQK